MCSHGLSAYRVYSYRALFKSKTTRKVKLMHKTINKALLLSAFLLAIMLSVGCSDDATVENGQAVDILARFNAEGKAWLSLDMTLPVTDNRSRAVSFADGDASEYAVKTLMLVLFRGSSTAEQGSREAADLRSCQPRSSPQRRTGAGLRSIRKAVRCQPDLR